MAPKKIAILGGGIGALTTAYELVRGGGDFDITVYQMGWRLGGKGATGRALAEGQGLRIEEHGLHMWSGLYDNAFRIMRECYAALGRKPGDALATVEEAFTPHDTFALYDEWKGRWFPFTFDAPRNGARPGEPNARLFLSLWDYVGLAVQVFALLFAALTHLPRARPGSFVVTALQVILTVVAFPFWLLGKLLWSLARAARLVSVLGNLLLLAPAHVVMTLFWWYARPRLDDTFTRRAWTLVNFAYANLRGALRDRVVELGMDRLDAENYVDWIARHMHPDALPKEGPTPSFAPRAPEGAAASPFFSGGSPTLGSCWMRFLYDAQFSYAEGDLAKPNLGAGAALRTLLRMGLTWKGALLWRMEGGMGEVVFVPLYEVLKARGVKFRFFHQVKSLAVDPSGSIVAAVRGVIQAKPKNGDYAPLFDVKGLPCWPSEPFWEQLEHGERLKGTNFESNTEPPGPLSTPFELLAGRDFDELVFGLPVGCVPFVAPELALRNPRWKAMLDAQKTVRTQAVQVWTSASKGELGAVGAGEALAVTYHPTPLNTMADMSFLIEKEAWTRATDRHAYPRSLFYFCGPLSSEPPAERALAAVEATARDLFNRLASPLFPLGTIPPKCPGAPFDWSLLVDDTSPRAEGPARLKAQYLRANTDPSELFTLTNVGATPLRISAHDTGFANLKVAGDWTSNTFNLANIEATVMSGMLCSQAICGFPANDAIVGLGFGSGKRQ